MDSEDDRYPFKVSRRYQGVAVVISNFTKGPHKRKGAEIDLKYMKKTFKRLGFKVDCHENLTTSKFISLLNSYSKDKSLQDYDCFVFAISSHGIEREVREKGHIVHHHAVLMFDDEYFDTHRVLDYFSPKTCKALKNKPKLFFIQACRIPQSKSSLDHRDAGVGFDHGTKPHRHGGGEKGQNKHGRDKIDHWEIKEMSDEESDTEGGDVSDTDIEEEDDLGGGDYAPKTNDQDTDTQREQDAKDIEKDLEQRQLEIVRHLKELRNEVWQLSRVYTPEADQNKETNNTEASAGRETPLAEVEQTEDELDAAKAIRLQSPAEKGMSGDEVDPAKARQYQPTVAPIHITSVPCHNDMLIMFASPQGLYAFRSKEEGSYMLRFLYEAVERFYSNGRLINNDTDFLEVLRNVTAKMSSRTFYGDKEYTNVPCTIHKLSKDIIFTQGKNMAKSKFSKKLSDMLTSFFTNLK